MTDTRCSGTFDKELINVHGIQVKTRSGGREGKEVNRAEGKQNLGSSDGVGRRSLVH